MQRPPQADDVLPIVSLVREKVDASGWSLRTFAETRRVAYSTLRRYYDKNLPALSQPPRRETLRELSIALDVPLGEIEQAALESLSYRAAPARQPLRETPQEPASVSLEQAIEDDTELHPAAKAHLLNQLELLRLLPPDIPIPTKEQKQRRDQARMTADDRSADIAIRRQQRAEKAAREPAPRK